MKKKILVTGSEGFLGKHLINFLLIKKYNLFATFKKKKNLLISKNITYFKCDVRNKKNLSKIIKKINPDIIFHLAAKSHPKFSFHNPVETLNTNVIGTANLLDTIKQLKINPKIVIACSSAQYGSRKINEYPLRETSGFFPDHVYGLSKNFQNLLSKQYFKMFNINISNAIIFNTSGPGKNNDIFFDISKQFNSQNKNKNTIKISCGNLSNKRDFLHYEDTVRGLYLIAMKGKPGESYNISTGKLVEINKLILYLKKKSNQTILIKKEKKRFRKFDEKYTSGDSKKLKKLGWKAKKNYKNILDEMCKGLN